MSDSLRPGVPPEDALDKGLEIARSHSDENDGSAPVDRPSTFNMKTTNPTQTTGGAWTTGSTFSNTGGTTPTTGQTPTYATPPTRTQKTTAPGLATPTGETSGRPEIPATAPAGVKLGKGLDVGTANLVSAVQNDTGGITIKMERNAFIDIKSDVYSKRMLTKLKVPYVVYKGHMIVLGDAAFELSNIFGRELRRPMKDGLISPSEVDALAMIRLIIEKVLGWPQVQNEPCFFSVPAASIDRNNNIIYHQGLFEGLLRKMGFAPKPMNEGHAVCFAELAEQNFTGIGISCGGGMINICLSYKTIPCLSFSICRGGDWIDQNVANVLGIPSSKATSIKERGVDLMNPTSREEEAIVIYYRNLINYVLLNIKAKFEIAENMPEFPDPIDIVCSGGTSMIKGFAEIFSDEFRKIEFPLHVREIRRAKEPLTSVAKGCLIAAAISENS